jgi:hypothetical protein
VDRGLKDKRCLAGGQTSLGSGYKLLAPSPSLGLPEATTRVKEPVSCGAGFRCQSLDPCGWASPTEDEDTQAPPCCAGALFRSVGADRGSFALPGANPARQSAVTPQHETGRVQAQVRTACETDFSSPQPHKTYPHPPGGRPCSSLPGMASELGFSRGEPVRVGRSHGDHLIGCHGRSWSMALKMRLSETGYAVLIDWAK